MADGGVVLVSFSGTASHIGTLSFVTVTHAADGTTVRWDGGPTSAHPAALVYVVKTVANAQVAPGVSPSGSPPSHPPWWAVGIAAVGGAALVGCVVTARRHRSPQNIPRQVSIRGSGGRR